MSVLDKRRLEIKQQDEKLALGENDSEQDKNDESEAVKKETDQRLSIYRYVY